MSVFVLASLLTLFSLVSLRISFEVPEIANALAFEACSAENFCLSAPAGSHQNKILPGVRQDVIIREPIITYLGKLEKSPPEIYNLPAMFLIT